MRKVRIASHRIAGKDETKFSFVENSVSKTTKHQNIKKEKNSFNFCVKKKYHREMI